MQFHLVLKHGFRYAVHACGHSQVKRGHSPSQNNLSFYISNIYISQLPKKTEFRNVLEIAVKSAVKVTNATLAPQKYPALAETSFNRFSLLKVFTLPNHRRAEGSSSPHNIIIHRGLVGRRSLGC